MSAAKDQDPSIEEILASIRQIISDDDEAAEAPAAQASPEPEEEEEEIMEEEVAEEAPVPEPTPEPEEMDSEDEDDILDLTEEVDETGFDIDMVDSAVDEMEEEEIMEEVEEEEDVFASQAAPAQPEKEIFTDIAAEATMGAFAKLADNVAVSRSAAGTTLEDIVRDLMRPMLRQWIHDNMPGIVESLVEKELDKILRRAVSRD